MTTINKQFEIENAEGAYYVFSSPSSEISFEPKTGVVPSSGTISSLITFQYNDSFDSPIELKVIQNEVCIKTYVFTQPSPCSVFDVSINETDEYLEPYIVGGVGPYEYQWTYNKDVLLQEDETLSVLSKVPTDASSVKNDISTDVILRVTDSKGCVTEVTYELVLRKPLIKNITLPVTCLAYPEETDCGITAYAKTAEFVIEDYYGSTLDFTTANFTSVYTNNDCLVATTTPGRYYLYTNRTNIDTDISIIGKIANTLGVYSNPFGIILQVTEDCSAVEAGVPVAANPVFDSIPPDVGPQIDTNYTDGAFYIYLENFTSNVDFESFDFVARTGQTRVSATELTGKRGTYEYLNGVIKYTDIGGTDTQEAVSFSISNPEGNKSIVATFMYNFEALPAPVLTDATVCCACDRTLSNVSILPIISGDFDPTTIEIVTPATNTTVTTNANGTLNFTQNTTNDLIDEVQIRVANYDGVLSNTATIYIMRVCSGKVANTVKNITCVPKTFNLLDVLLSATNYYVNGYSQWVETTVNSNTFVSQGGVIGASSTGAVNFSGIDPGTYTFQIGGVFPCTSYNGTTLLNTQTSSTSTVTIIMDNQETLTHGTLSYSLVGGTNYTVTIPYTITDYASLTDFKVFVDGVQATVNSNTIDSEGNGEAKITVTGTGTFNIMTQILSKCGNIISDTDAIIIS